MEPERLSVSIKETAYMLGVSRSTIEKWIKDGKLQAVKVREGQRSAHLVIFASIKKLLGQDEAA